MLLIDNEESCIKPVYNSYEEIPEMTLEEAGNFTIHEVRCHCGCGQQIVNGKLLHILQTARMLAGTPFIITSWNRCKIRNERMGGAEGSAHLKGYAVDISVYTPQKRFIVTAALISAGMPRIKLYPGHIHCDVDPDKAWGVIML